MPRKMFVHAATLLSACVLTSRAADSTGIQAAVQTPPIAADTGAAPKSIPLLPDPLGPMESMLWSQHGFMRNNFDFPLTEDGREHEMHLRRTMLTMHEIGGFTTLAAMIATCVAGQLAYNQYPNRISPGLGSLKKDLGWTTVFLYFGTASLSIFTPPPMVRHREWNSVSTHKLLATIHFTGMILTPILASQIGNERRGNFSRNVETVHMVSGYTTTAAFAAAMMVIVF